MDLHLPYKKSFLVVSSHAPKGALPSVKTDGKSQNDREEKKLLNFRPEWFAQPPIYENPHAPDLKGLMAVTNSGTY